MRSPFTAMFPAVALVIAQPCAAIAAPAGHERFDVPDVPDAPDAPEAPDVPGAERGPNVVIILTDDQGFGDLACYGHPTLRTPHLDALAASGARFTQCYVASPVCSPSRAALLTGCYPKRVGMHHHVIFPEYDYGLHTDEVTLADLLRGAGYATGCFGKWHLGHRPGLMPTDQGFEVYFGVPYSNDMAQIHRKPGDKYPYRLPLFDGREVIEWEPDQRQLTRRYTEAAVAFIEAHARDPFFVYLPHSMPHIPIYASDAFEGTSARGLYGDVIEELDWSVGQVVAALERSGVRDNTLVVFLSDNGPWLQYKLKGGSAGPLRGGKGTNWEGGQRVPCIVSWPGHVPAGRVALDVITTMDLLPTVAGFAHLALPEGRPVDGRDVGALLLGGGDEARPAPAVAEFLYYTSNGDLAGVRRGPWKLLLQGDQLFHLERDVSEQFDVASEHPALVAELRALAVARDAEIAANARPVRHVSETCFDPAGPNKAAGEGR
ncbi:MAG: sulfatase [Planctomycetota bacterium]